MQADSLFMDSFLSCKAICVCWKACLPTTTTARDEPRQGGHCPVRHIDKRMDLVEGLLDRPAGAESRRTRPSKSATQHVLPMTVAGCPQVRLELAH